MTSVSLDRAEYVEQAYLYQLLCERVAQQVPMQELLEQLQHELLATTRLPMAIDFLLTELKHSGLMAPAMRRLAHYFNPFQTFLIEQAELETGRFAMSIALQILHADAKFRADERWVDQDETDSQQASPRRQAAFFYQFEVLCRNRLNYDKGLTAMSGDPTFDKPFAAWILKLRAEIGLVDMADLIYLASQYYRDQLVGQSMSLDGKGPFLFGVKEGRISLANRRKEPLYLFGAMQRHLGYPPVPRPKPVDDTVDLIPAMARRIERLESRIKLMEDERRAAIDITKFYEKDS